MTSSSSGPASSEPPIAAAAAPLGAALALPTRARRAARVLAIVLALGAYVAIAAFVVRRHASEAYGPTPRVLARGGALWIDGEKLLVKAVGWDPTRPGELPWARRRSRDLVDHDLSGMRAAGFNTVRSWEALVPAELAAAERHGLFVVQGIWVDRDGDFRDRAFRATQLAKVDDVVAYSRTSPAVIAYLVMNEPSPEHVLRVGEEATRAFLRELRDRIRERHPGALVGFSSWPGLELLDEPTLDLVAVNLHPFRPRALLDAIGYPGMVQLWRRLAGDRPLFVSEFGISVSPGVPGPDEPGGASEAEQAEGLPRLAEAIVAQGAAGGAAFLWIDGWWKNADSPGDELTHDPDDGEEWFGLYAMEHLDDTTGRARPALAALHAWNLAVLTLPEDGPVHAREVEVEVHTEVTGPVGVEASIAGAPWSVVPTLREGPWMRGRLGLHTRVRGPQRVRFRVVDSHGQALAEIERRLLPPGEAPLLSLSVEGNGPWRKVRVRATDAEGNALAGADVRVGTAEASRRFDRTHRLTTDAQGAASVDVELPPHPVPLLLVAALRDGESETPLALEHLLIRQEDASR